MDDRRVVDWIRKGVTPGELEWHYNNKQISRLIRRHDTTRYELNCLRERWGIRGEENEMLP